MGQTAPFFVSIVLGFSSTLSSARADSLPIGSIWYPQHRPNSLTGSLRLPRPLRGLNRSFATTSNGRTHNSSVTTDNYGVSKGLEIIPAKNAEVILSVPPYVVNDPDSLHDGFGGWQFLGKYR